MGGTVSTQDAVIVFMKYTVQCDYFLASSSACTFPREKRCLVFHSFNSSITWLIFVSFIWSRIHPSLIYTSTSSLLFFLQIPVFLDCLILIILWLYISVYKMYIDRVQHTLPQNMVPWHIEYFKLMEFKKIRAGKTDFPLKQVLNPHVRSALPTPGGNEHPYLHDGETPPRGVWVNRPC